MSHYHFVLFFKKGNYLPGLHDLVAEMKVGETRTGISMDAGWGDRNPDLIVTVPFEGSGLDPSQIKVGTQLFLATQNVPCSVTEVTDTTFTIDANPPLAGASYKATVTLKAVEEGPVITPYSEESSGTSRFEVATFALGCFWGGACFDYSCVAAYIHDVLRIKYSYTSPFSFLWGLAALPRFQVN